MTGNRTSALNCGSYRGVALFVTLETRTTSRTKFHFKSSRLSEKKNTPRKTTVYFFAPEKLARLFLLMKVYLSPDRKMISLLLICATATFSLKVVKNP